MSALRSSPSPDPANRRRHQRYVTPPMYTGIAVRPLDEEGFRFEGHAYNISEGGIQFELDHPIEPGRAVALRIDLPAPLGFASRRGLQPDIGPGRAVFAIGNVVWIDDDDVAGPVRHAVAFTRFCRLGDRERLLRQLTSGLYTLVA